MENKCMRTWGTKREEEWIESVKKWKKHLRESSLPITKKKRIDQRKTHTHTRTHKSVLNKKYTRLMINVDGIRLLLKKEASTKLTENRGTKNRRKMERNECQKATHDWNRTIYQLHPHNDCMQCVYRRPQYSRKDRKIQIAAARANVHRFLSISTRISVLLLRR